VLEGSASESLWSYETDATNARDLTLQELKDKLVNQFGHILTRPGDYSNLYAIQQVKNETVEALVDHIIKIERKLPGQVPPEVQETVLLQALWLDIQIAVHLQRPEGREAVGAIAHKVKEIYFSIHCGRHSDKERNNQGEGKEYHNLFHDRSQVRGYHTMICERVPNGISPSDTTATEVQYFGSSDREVAQGRLEKHVNNKETGCWPTTYHSMTPQAGIATPDAKTGNREVVGLT
jgi:hypothetical protein